MRDCTIHSSCVQFSSDGTEAWTGRHAKNVDCLAEISRIIA